MLMTVDLSHVSHTKCLLELYLFISVTLCLYEKHALGAGGTKSKKQRNIYPVSLYETQDKCKT